MISDATALILAGGDSRRMGQDKPTLLLEGETLLARVAGSMQALFPEVLVSVRSHRMDLPWQQVCDADQGAGPLVEVLAAARGNYQAVVPVVGGYPQPLAAFYARSALADLQHFAAGGGRSLRDSLAQLQVNFVDETALRPHDPQLRSFFDLDTPQDVEAALKRG